MEMDYPKTRMDNFFAKAAGSELADNSMEPITDREYWINEMAEKINSGGGGLPAITEGDEGKVLTVDEGEAVWAEGGGGGGGTKVYLAQAVTTEGGQVPDFVDNVSYNTLKADTDNGVLPVLLYAFIDTEQEQTTTTVATLTRLILYDDGACEATFTDGLFFVAYAPTEKLAVRS